MNSTRGYVCCRSQRRSHRRDSRFTSFAHCWIFVNISPFSRGFTDQRCCITERLKTATWKETVFQLKQSNEWGRLFLRGSECNNNLVSKNPESSPASRCWVNAIQRIIAEFGRGHEDYYDGSNENPPGQMLSLSARCLVAGDYRNCNPLFLVLRSGKQVYMPFKYARPKSCG